MAGRGVLVAIGNEKEKKKKRKKKGASRFERAGHAIREETRRAIQSETKVNPFVAKSYSSRFFVRF